MASGVPERPFVLRRLGIIKNEADTEFLQPPVAPVAAPEDGLDSFGSETGPGLLHTIADRAAAAVTATTRKPWMLIGGLSVILFVAGVLAINVLFGPPEPSVAAAVEPAAGTEAPPPSPAAAAKAVSSKPLRAATASPAASGTVAASARHDETIVAEGSPSTTASAPFARADAGEEVAPPTPVEEVAAPAAVPLPAAVIADDTIYSVEDVDVIPPRTAERLPDPAISQWTTRTNAMELIVSEAGAVEHVRLMGAPQRMPDVLVLSRAKMWKFTPAMKDGRPVRYRLRLSWEVNP